jgi:hypothetical protein
VDRRQFLSEVAEIDWARLRGAYGASDGSVVRRGRTLDGPEVTYQLGDVPAALEVLSTGRDEGEDSYQDALDVLQSHVWHQGDIYPVTPVVARLLAQLIDLPNVVGRDALASVLVLISDSARHERSTEEPERRAVAAAVDAALCAEQDRVMRWLDEDLAPHAVLIALRGEGCRTGMLAALEQRLALPFFVWIALAELDRPPAWAGPRAEAALEDPAPLVRLAAAAFLARRCGPTGALAARVEAALPPSAAVELARALALPADIVVSPPRAPPPAELVAATVVFAGPRLVVAQLAEGRNITIPWPQSGLLPGEQIRVGLSPHGEPRVVEHSRADGAIERFEL